ncbi:MAG: hypothetical protein K8U03_17840 [Planctomycetia bacterium]|nr:hypothetical protein [Planctomycetia bacterium]
MSDSGKAPEKEKAKPLAKPDAEKKVETKAEKKVEASPAPAIDPPQTNMTSAWKYTRPLTACRYDPSGKYIFAGTEDYTIQRFRTADGVATPLLGHESWCRAFAFPLAGKVMVSGGYDGKLLWWTTDEEKPVPLRSVAAHEGWVRAVAASNDGKFVASCGNDGLVKLWNAADGKLVRTFAKHDSHAYHLAFHPDGERLVSCDLKCICKVWNLKDGKSEREFVAAPIHKYDTTFRADMGGARSISFGAGGKLLAIGGTSNISNAFAGIGNATWFAIDWETGKPKTTHVGKEKLNGTGWGLAWHPEGFWIGAAGGQTGFLYFFKPDQENEFFRFKLPDTARDMTLSPDAKSVAVAHADGNLRVYRLGKG